MAKLNRRLFKLVFSEKLMNNFLQDNESNKDLIRFKFLKNQRLIIRELSNHLIV